MSKLIVFIALLPFAACSTSPESALEANKDAVRGFVAAYNSGNFDSLDELMAVDVVRHSQASGIEVNTLEELKENFRMAAAAFPDATEEIHAMIAEGDKVAVHGTWTATQEGPYGPFPATGESTELEFFYLFRIEDGKIAEFWAEWDNLSMLTQLGHFPPQPES
jgi:steroid delta-isomerase-like uncharacterized protein